MRYLYITLIVLFTAVILIFMFQNLEVVSVSLFSAGVTLPVSLLVLVSYILGMFTGGFVLSLVKSMVHGAIPPPDSQK
jgi:putative membrane protein